MGFTLEQAAREMEMSKTALIRLEKGHNEKVKLRDVEGFGRLYELDEGQIDELKILAQQASTRSWWLPTQHLIKPGFATYLGLEAGADLLRVYQPLMVPGLLQVAGYARAIERPHPNSPDDTPEDLERRVELRLRRTAILTRQRNPTAAEFIIHEGALHTAVGSPLVMAAQCRHMADMSTLTNITIRILPFTAGFPGSWNPVLPYIILDFPASSREFGAEPPVIYTETTIGAMFLEEAADVSLYRDIHQSLQSAALPAQPSRDLLRQVARRYER
ncbi:MAG: helix-turn-helix domain-containing protein [Nocardia sp.]|nr:helix-turn-helix domain-containing protein [Nocardia sp.]